MEHNCTTTNYSITPGNDSIVNSENYQIIENVMSSQPLGARQMDNKLYGITESSLQEYLLMDFDANVGDTISDLYSEGYLYDAVVIEKDSTQDNLGGYLHMMQLTGIGYYDSSTFISETWNFTWYEKALCGRFGFNGDLDNLGGVLFNIPHHIYSISGTYTYPNYCTIDPRYPTPSGTSCQECQPVYSIIVEPSTLGAKLWPNPASSAMNLTLPKIGNYEISILDIHGRSLIRSLLKGASTQINVENLPSGMYYIEVKSSSSKEILKLMKR